MEEAPADDAGEAGLRDPGGTDLDADGAADLDGDERAEDRKALVVPQVRRERLDRVREQVHRTGQIELAGTVRS